MQLNTYPKLLPIIEMFEKAGSAILLNVRCPLNEIGITNLEVIHVAEMGIFARSYNPLSRDVYYLKYNKFNDFGLESEENTIEHVASMSPDVIDFNFIIDGNTPVIDFSDLLEKHLRYVENHKALVNLDYSVDVTLGAPTKAPQFDEIAYNKCKVMVSSVKHRIELFDLIQMFDWEAYTLLGHEFTDSDKQNLASLIPWNKGDIPHAEQMDELKRIVEAVVVASEYRGIISFVDNKFRK